MSAWPFADAPDTPVFALRRIINRQTPILSVYHNTDGEWHFLTNDPRPDASDAATVPLKEIIDLDPTLRELADLPRGWCAWRIAANAPWDRSVAPASAEPPEDDDNPQVVRHERRTKPFEPAIGNEDSIEAICKHFDEHIGEATSVLHEVLSDLVHIDVHIIPPAEDRPYWTLFTTGMSDRPMAAPEGLEDCRYAELMIKLPPDWPVDRIGELNDDADPAEAERFYWPVRWLKNLARLPHEFDTWLWACHTVPNGDPPEPVADDADFCCMLVLPPLEDPPFGEIEVEPGKTVCVFNVIPLYRAEMELKLREGSDALIDAFAEAGITDIIDPTRPSAV